MLTAKFNNLHKLECVKSDIKFTGNAWLRCPKVDEFFIDEDNEIDYVCSDTYDEEAEYWVLEVEQEASAPKFFSYGWVAMDSDGVWFWYPTKPTAIEYSCGAIRWHNQTGSTACTDDDETWELCESLRLGCSSEYENSEIWTPPTNVEPKDSLMKVHE